MNILRHDSRLSAHPENLTHPGNWRAECSGERTRRACGFRRPRRNNSAKQEVRGSEALLPARGSAYAPLQRVRDAAYSLIEVMIAAGVLLTGIAAAAMMAHTMFLQEEANGRVTRGLNLQEQAATLWQIGLESDTITNVLPEKCVPNNPPGADAVYFNFSTNANITALGPGVVESINLSIVFHSATDANGNLVYQTNAVTVVRPSTR